MLNMSFSKEALNEVTPHAAEMAADAAYASAISSAAGSLALAVLAMALGIAAYSFFRYSCPIMIQKDAERDKNALNRQST